jgi:hypothetical protein
VGAASDTMEILIITNGGGSRGLPSIARDDPDPRP